MDSAIKTFVEDFVQEGKRMMVIGDFLPCVIMIVDFKSKGGLQAFHLKGSEDFFEKGIDKKKSILMLVRKMMGMVNNEINKKAELAAVVCVSDVSFKCIEHQGEIRTDEEAIEWARKYESQQGYVSPLNDPTSVEALCICVNCRDKSYLFQYTYERRNGAIVFVPGKLDFEMGNALGNLAEVFPDELK